MPQESWTMCALLFLENVWNPCLLSTLVPWDRQPWPPRQEPGGPLNSLLWALTHPQASASCFVLSWDTHGPSSHYMWICSHLWNPHHVQCREKACVLPAASFLCWFRISGVWPPSWPLTKSSFGVGVAAGSTQHRPPQTLAVDRRTGGLGSYSTSELALTEDWQLHRSLKCGDLY